VWGSGAAGILCAALALLTNDTGLWQASCQAAAVCFIRCYQQQTDAPVIQVGFVASFASKLSDTVSSEIGKVRFAAVP